MFASRKLIVLPAALALALAACGGDDDSGGEIELPADAYYELMQDLDAFADAGPEQLDEIGQAICGVLDVSEPDEAWLLAVKVMTDTGVSGFDGGAAIRYAVQRHCPDLLPLLPDA